MRRDVVWSIAIGSTGTRFLTWRSGTVLFPVLCVPGHGHRPAHASENIDPVVGGASWSGAPHVRPPSRHHVSFADEVTMLGDAEVPVCSPEAELPPLILPVVVEEISDAPEPESPPLILPKSEVGIRSPAIVKNIGLTVLTIYI